VEIVHIFRILWWAESSNEKQIHTLKSVTSYSSFSKLVPRNNAHRVCHFRKKTYGRNRVVLSWVMLYSPFNTLQHSPFVKSPSLYLHTCMADPLHSICMGLLCNSCYNIGFCSFMWDLNIGGCRFFLVFLWI